MKNIKAVQCQWSHWRPPRDEVEHREEVLGALTDDEGLVEAERRCPTWNQRRKNAEVQGSTPTPASIRAQQQGWAVQLACWAGQLGYPRRDTTGFDESTRCGDYVHGRASP